MLLVLDWDGTCTEVDGLHMILERFGDREVYVVAGTSHTFLANDLSAFKTGTNITMLEWVTKLATNDTGWTNINP